MATMIINEHLLDTYNYWATIENIIAKEIRTIRGNRYQIDKIVPVYLIKTISPNENKSLDFADNITRTIYEAGVVALVAAFEKVVFAKYKTSYGKIKSVVSDKAEKPLDFHNSRERFVNDKIDRLALILDLIEGHINADMHRMIKEIKDHRNYIAHGKRDVAPPLVTRNLNEIATLLDNVITEIEK